MSQTVATFATIFFSMILVNNYVLVQFPFVSLFGMSAEEGMECAATYREIFLENKMTMIVHPGNYSLIFVVGGGITYQFSPDSKEIVRCGGLDGRVNIALDYFDASINRISAWTVGFRNVEKALLSALCTPHTALKELQDTNQFTELMVRQEELKTLPFGEVWDEYCHRNGVPVDGAWFEEVTV